MPTPLENLQKSHNKLESDYYKNHEKKWQVELDEAKGKLKTVNERLQNKTDPKYDNLLGAKKLLEEKIQNILKLEIPHAIEDSLREAEAMRLEENIKIAEEKFKGDASTDYEGFKKFQLEKIKKLFENGVDVVVTHGNDVRDPKTREAMYDKNGRKLMSTSTDQDANAAFMFLELANTGRKYNFAYREVKGSGATGLQSSSHEFVPKGESHIPTKEDWGKTFLHIDTSGRKGVSIEYDNKTETTHIYVDHHVSKTLKENTSAGELTLDLLKNLDMIKAEPWMEAYAKFNTEHDNFTFKIDRDHLINNYWKTPRGLMKVIPREQFIQFFKDGRDPDVPFTDAELDSINIGGKTLRTYAESQKKHMSYSRDLVAKGEIEAVVEGVASYTPELGVISFNTVQTKTDPEGKIKDFNNAAEGGVVAKALGIQTFIKFWENGGGFFMTSTNDLTKLYERVKDKIPGLKLIRGKMLIYAQPNDLPTKDLDEVIYNKETNERYKKSETDPKVYAEAKKRAESGKELMRIYYVEKNRKKLDKQKMLEIMGLLETNNYENLPEKKLERTIRILEQLENDPKEKARKAEIEIALKKVRDAKSKIAPEKEATPEEIKALLESVRGTISTVQETRTSLGNEIAVLKESIAEYETLINEEEAEDTESEPVVTKAASKKKAPKSSPAPTANPDAKTDTALEKEADLQALKNLNAGESLVYRNADGTFSYKKVNMITKTGKIRFDGETAWISADTIQEWIKEKHATGTNPDTTIEPINIREPKKDDVLISDSGKVYTIRGFSPKGGIQFIENATGGKGVWAKNKFETYINEGKLEYTDPTKVDDTPSLALTPEPIVASSSAAEIYNSWDKADIETFKIYQSGMMIGEKKGAVEKVFAMNKSSNEVLPIEEGWKYATSGGQKDFEYFYGELFDVKSIKSIKGLKFSDFDITPAKMNPDGTLKEKGRFTIKK